MCVCVLDSLCYFTDVLKNEALNLIVQYTVKVQLYACEKFMRFSKIWLLNKFMRFLFLRFCQSNT